MDASIEILSSSLVPLEEQPAQASCLRVYSRIKVAQGASETPFFDYVTISLYGAVITKIGSRTATEKVGRSVSRTMAFANLEQIFEISKEKRRADFSTSSPSKGSSDVDSFADVTFCVLPKPGSVNPDSHQSFIPSLCITGETYITTSDVLSSQQLVKGRCDVIYWIEADFRHKKQTVRKLQCPLDISKASAPLQLQVTARSKTGHIAVPIKPLKWPMMKRGWPLKSRKRMIPKMTVHLPKDLGLVYAAKARSDSQFQIVAVPLIFNVEQPAASDRSIHDMMGNLLPKVSVEAIWHTHKVFSATNLANGHSERNSVQSCKISKRSVVKQKQRLELPPFYQKQVGQTFAGDADNDFSATASLELLLPDTVKSPSIGTRLLRVSYELELRISVGEEGEDGIVPCAAAFKVPLHIEST